MRFVCDSCRAQYMISDEKVGAKGVKVRCKKCGYVILVRRQETGAAPSAAASAGDEAPASSTPTGGSAGKDSIFKGMEDDEIGAVFNQVLSSTSGSHPRPPQLDAVPPSSDSEDFEADATRVMDLATVRKLAEAAGGESGKATVNGSGHGPAGATAVAASVQPQHEWFVAIDERQVGPLNLEKVKDHWDRGEIGPDSLCWRSGFSDWIPVSEAAELAAVLAPPAPKPVIAAPMATLSAGASAPVGSAFAAGATTKSPSGREMPVLTPEPATETASVTWKPSAASALASLVQDEMVALTTKPPPKSNGKSATQEMPAAPAVQGLLDVPDHPAPNMPPATDRLPGQSSSPPGPNSNGYGTYVPSYTVPSPPASRGRGLMIAVVALGSVVVLVLLVAVGFLLYQSTQKPPPAVMAVAVPPPVAPAPVVVASAKPVPTAPPATGPAAPGVQATPQAPLPPIAGPSPDGRYPGRRHAKGQRGSEAATPGKTAETPSGGSPGKVDEPTGDEFDKEFGGSPSKPAAPNRPNKASVYVPPPPGEASIPDTLEQSDIMQVVLSHKPAILKCVEEQKKREPGAGSGKMVMRWSVLPSGKTSGIAVQTEAMKSSYLAGCLTGQVRSWAFPRHKTQGEPIDFPFTF